MAAGRPLGRTGAAADALGIGSRIAPMHLALFDLDPTLLPTDHADTWSRHRAPRGGLDPAEYGARIRRLAEDFRLHLFEPAHA